MSPNLKNILAIILGLIVGSLVNGGIVGLSFDFVPPPEGINPNDINSMRASAHLYQPIHFLFPFLAHALGTFIGAFLTARFAATHKKIFALAVGVFFLIGGAYMATVIPVIWFVSIDLTLAYLPMGWLAWKLNKEK